VDTTFEMVPYPVAAMTFDHSEQPLVGLAIRPVTQLVRELEYGSRAEGWHADPSAWKFVKQEK
jgi:hypothetical protein